MSLLSKVAGFLHRVINSAFERRPRNKRASVSNGNKETFSHFQETDNSSRLQKVEPEPASPKQAAPVLKNDQSHPRALKPVEATIIVLFLNQQGNQIADPEIIHGNLGQPADIKFRQFKNYHLIGIHGYTLSFVHRHAVVTLNYEKALGGSVWALCRDYINSNLLSKPQFYQGKIGEAYSVSIPQIRNYIFMRAEGQLEGRFSSKQKLITLFYKNATWTDVYPESGLLKMLRDTSCYSDIEGEKLDTPLAAGSIWRTFYHVDLISGARWYNLGGSIWVESSRNMTFVSPYKDEQPDESLANMTAVSVRATIDFIPGKSVMIFNRPCGKKIASLDNGLLVDLVKYCRADGMDWFFIKERGWIPAIYLKF